MPAKVTLVLKGLIAVTVKPDRSQCMVGVLADAPPDHQLKIIFRQPGPAGSMEEHARLEPPDIAYNLRLDVENISQERVTLRKWPTSINRQLDPIPGTKDSFSWVVDLENLELYDGPIGARKSAFSPILTFTNGDLFTHTISRNHLFTQRGIFAIRRFGFVGTVIGADFLLDQPESAAVFFNGLEPITPPNPSANWEIEINNDAEAHADIVTDANHYYKAVGLQLTEAQRFLFMSKRRDPGAPPAGPEAACFATFLGKSDPQG